MIVYERQKNLYNDGFLPNNPLTVPPFSRPLLSFPLLITELSGDCNLRGKHLEQEGEVFGPPLQVLGYFLCLFYCSCHQISFIFPDFSHIFLVPSVPLSVFLHYCTSRTDSQLTTKSLCCLLSFYKLSLPFIVASHNTAQFISSAW